MEKFDIDSIINVDLHIHTSMSKFKEPYVNHENLVENSTEKNLPLLLKKLEENKINMFAFSDHNRFNIDLFKKARMLIGDSKFKYVQTILPAVEFDVQIEKDRPSFHLLTVFDSKNDDDLKRIAIINENGKIKRREDFYELSDFVRMMKDIGLSTIFIGCQRKSLNNPNGGSNSYSDSLYDPINFLKTGFISALEYQKPQVEGILKNDLRDFPQEIACVAGSDCHQWGSYPFHDEASKSKEHSFFFKIKAQPTFMGLLLSVTSPKTRFNRRTNEEKGLLESFRVGEKEFQVSKGINAIIGENGSGKSTLLSGLCHQDKKEKYIKEILKSNKFETMPKEISVKNKAISQNELISNENSKDGTIFGNYAEFGTLDNQKFSNSMNEYANKIWSKIQTNMLINKLKVDLKGRVFTINIYYEGGKRYFINVIPDNRQRVLNDAEDRLKNLNNILNSIKKELNNSFYDKEQLKKLNEAFLLISNLRNQVKKKYEFIKAKNEILGHIIHHINDYQNNVKAMSTTVEGDINSYKGNKLKFINLIVDICKEINKKSKTKPEEHTITTIEGQVKKQSGEFIFLRTAKYYFLNDNEAKETLLKSIFNKEYQTQEGINNIIDENVLKKAISNCKENPDTSFKKNADKAIEDLCTDTKSVITISNSSKNILGFTLGEKSLMFYRFLTFSEKEIRILFIDQPEDNLSNKNVIFELRKYFNELRDNDVQIFIVTHNPMLVVNLDVDNVISCHLNNGKMEIKAGPLESDGMLKEILEVMDGSREEIEKRVKLYANS